MMFWTIVLLSLICFIFEWRRGVTSRTSRVLLFISSGLLFVAIAFNTDSPDWARYAEKFNNLHERMEPGFMALNYVVRSLGGTFETLLLIIALLVWITLILINRSAYNNLVILLYAIYPFVLDLTQYRNTIMYFIMLLVFALAAHKHALLYYGGVLLASSFHVLALFYLPLYPLLKFSRRTFYRLLGYFFVVLSLVMVITKLMLPTIVGWVNLKSFTYYANYFGDFAWFYFGIQVLHIFMDVYTVWTIDRYLSPQSSLRSSPSYETFYRAVWYSALYLPVVAFFDEFYRFRRNIQLVKYLLAAMALKEFNRRQQVYVIALLLINLVLTLIMMIAAEDMVLFSSVENNKLLQFVQTFGGR